MANLMFKRPVDGALYMHERGFKVFPLQPNAKVPAFEGWQEWAEQADYKRIQGFGTAQPTYNWGVHAGATGHTAIDLDNKGGRYGLDNLTKILKEQEIKMPETLTVITPTGGLHWYYTGKTPNTNDTIAKGVETRCKGQYVVCPGSRIKENIYEVQSDTTVAELPEKFLSLIPRNTDKPLLEESIQIEEGNRVTKLVSIAGAMRAQGMNHEAILAALTVMNDTQTDSPLPEAKILDIAKQVSKYQPKEAVTASDFLEPIEISALTWNNINPETIKKRDWVMGGRYIGGFISVVIAPGGVGKSMITMLDALSVATGKPLTGYKINKPGAVWLYNTEDPLEEIKRRAVALSIHNKIPLSGLSNIHSTSGRDKPFILAKAGRDGVVVNKTAIDETIRYIKENNIVLLIADPFVRTHEVSENDNMQIDKVVWCFQRIADKTGCAIGLVHHTSKGSSSPGDMDKARGASSLVNASRIAHTVAVMEESEAKKFGIPAERRKWFLRMDNAKANLQAPADSADWFEKLSVELPNGEIVGAIKKANVKELAEARKIEALKADCADLARLLDELMSVGDVFAVKVVHEHASLNDDYSHIFNGKTDTKTGINELISLFKLGVSTDTKRFEYSLESEKKTKHWVKCIEKISIENEMFQ